MRNTWNLMMAAIICAGLQVGCGGGGGEEEGPPAPSAPEEVVLTVLKALAAGDGDTAVACYDCSTEDKEYMVHTMPFRRTLINLGNAGAKAYGADVWEAAQNKAGVGVIIPDMANAEKNIQCTIIGDKATCKLKGFLGTLNLAKRSGKWLIIPQPGQFPPLHQRGDILKSILTTKAAIDAVIPKVGVGNVSADDICAEVKKILNVR